MHNLHATCRICARVNQARWLEEAHLQGRQFLRSTINAFLLELYKIVDKEIKLVYRYSAIVNSDSENYIVMSRVLMYCKLYAGGILGYFYFVAMKSAAE